MPPSSLVLYRRRFNFAQQLSRTICLRLIPKEAPFQTTRQFASRKLIHVAFGTNIFQNIFHIAQISLHSSYLWINLLEVPLLLIHLEVDLRGRDGDGARGGYARGHQDGRRADVDGH